MKKILMFLCAFSFIFIPIKASATSYSFEGYYCDEKQALDDETFTMTCHIIVTTDFDVNHISGSLILKNLTLQSIKTSSDWVSNNGLSTEVDFTSSTVHSGSFSVADLLFTGNLSDTECEASFAPNVPEKVNQDTTDKTCAIIDDEYYGSDGTLVSEDIYYEECCSYTCTVVDNKYYFDSNGKSVTYDEMLSDCSTTEVVNPKTGIDYGYIIIPIGILGIIGIIRFSKKNSKIYKI